MQEIVICGCTGVVTNGKLPNYSCQLLLPFEINIVCRICRICRVDVRTGEFAEHLNLILLMNRVPVKYCTFPFASSFCSSYFRSGCALEYPIQISDEAVQVESGWPQH